MKRQTKCPICDSSINWVYWTGPFGIEEEYIDCDHCGYSYEFVYGNYAAFIKGEECSYSYEEMYLEESNAEENQNDKP